MDWGTEGLLDGLEGEARAARVRLLDALHGDGVAVEELRAAAADDRLVLVPIERALLAPPVYTLAEVAQRAEVDAELAASWMRTIGVSIPEDPEVAAFGDDEVAAVARTAEYAARGFDVEEGRVTMHLLARAIARVAEPLRRRFAEAYLEPGIAEDDLARRYGEMAHELLPLVAADIEYLLRVHLRDDARNAAITAAERSEGRLPDSVDMAVAFADIVGFTALGEEVDETALTDIAAKLEELAGEHVRPPARVVKTIGDAVMVVGRDAQGVLDSMLDLVAASGALEEMPPLRAGIAWGRAVPRLGDWFGPTVNLAARLTQRARPDAVLVSNPVRDVLGDEAADAYTFSEAGLKRFKGIHDPVPALRVRRATA